MASRRRTADVAALLERARAGESAATARLISLVENDSPDERGVALLREVAELAGPFTGHAEVLGITGSPGVGKSSATSALLGALRSAGRRVAVLAVDPSSPYSGGALLGDRIRMAEHATDRAVFIRSMASRGQLGGLSAAAPQALRVLDAAGFDVVLIETVGVGQSEVDVMRLADSTLLLLAPGMGDGIQAAKAGVLEIADVFVVNKADRPGAEQVRRDLRNLQSLGAGAGAGDGDGERSGERSARWLPPIVSTVATSGEGIEELLSAVAAHRDWLRSADGLRLRRQARAQAEVSAIALDRLRRRFAAVSGAAGLDKLSSRVAAGELDPYTASDELIAALPDNGDTPD